MAEASKEFKEALREIQGKGDKAELFKEKLKDMRDKGFISKENAKSISDMARKPPQDLEMDASQQRNQGAQRKQSAFGR